MPVPAAPALPVAVLPVTALSISVSDERLAIPPTAWQHELGFSTLEVVSWLPLTATPRRVRGASVYIPAPGSGAPAPRVPPVIVSPVSVTGARGLPIPSTRSTPSVCAIVVVAAPLPAIVIGAEISSCPPAARPSTNLPGPSMTVEPKCRSAAATAARSVVHLVPAHEPTTSAVPVTV